MSEPTKAGSAAPVRNTCPCCGRWVGPGYYDRDINPAAPVQYVYEGEPDQDGGQAASGDAGVAERVRSEGRGAVREAGLSPADAVEAIAWDGAP